MRSQAVYHCKPKTATLSARLGSGRSYGGKVRQAQPIAAWASNTFCDPAVPRKQSGKEDCPLFFPLKSCPQASGQALIPFGLLTVMAVQVVQDSKMGKSVSMHEVVQL